MTVVLAAVACTVSAPPVATAAASEGAARAQQPAALDWKPCSNPEFDRWKRVDDDGLEGFECATFVRPLDRGRPDGKQVTLAVVRFKATGSEAEHRGTLFLNPGGPGQSGVGLAKIVFLLPESVRAASTSSPTTRAASAPPPRRSRAGAATSRSRAGRPPGRCAGGRSWPRASARWRAPTRCCFAANRDLVEHAGTVDGAYDLDALRAAVGDDTITYWGISYGSLLGSTYAQLFPDRVRAMVFDGNLDPQIDLSGISAGSVAPDHSIGFFLQATGLRGEVRRGVGEAERSNHPSPRRDALHALGPARRAQRRRRLLPHHRRRGWTQAAEAVTDSWNALFGPDAEQGAARRALTEKSLQSPSTGTAGSLWSAVVCQDFSDRLSNARQQELLRGIVREGPIYGGSLGVDYLTTCNGYDGAEPHPVPRPAQYGPPIPGMIANATRDGETPYQWAVNMARVYPTMRAVTIVGGVHGTFGLSQSQCVDTAIADFLVSATPPAIDIACPYSPPDPAP